jgi:hypothetical protein
VTQLYEAIGGLLFHPILFAILIENIGRKQVLSAGAVKKLFRACLLLREASCLLDKII